MLFTKTPGFRITEIQLQSCKNLVDTDGKLITFRITSLFNGQKLEIKNCILELEMFGKTTDFRPLNIF